MATWRDQKILELANQLTYSRAEKRQEQLRAAMTLLGDIDPSKTYPWDFVHFRVTGFQLREHSDHVLSGKVLRADLATLMEFLSDTLSLKVEEVGEGESVLTLEELAQKFSVSSKTLQRWRKQGLIGLRYVYPDGRRRLGFLESAVSGFAAANKERVERSAAFTQVTEEERAGIIARGRQLMEEGAAGIKEVSLQIAAEIKRSPEAIRSTLRRYDEEHRESRIFAERGQGSLRRSRGAAAMPEMPAQKEPLSAFHQATAQRAERVRGVFIDFVANPLFGHPDADTIILKDLPATAVESAMRSVAAGTNARSRDVFMIRTPRDLPAFLQDIFRQPVMPAELEIDAFRRMNYLKYKASQLQLGLYGETASPGDLAEIETLLVQANEIKNQILQSNLRVAAHVARKHQRIDRPLIELVSDATMWLMRAVEKYDFSRNTKFTTYASYSIMKNFANGRADRLSGREAGVLTGQQETLDAAHSPEASPVTEQIDLAALQNDLLHVIQELPERERELLTTHYGLDQTKPALSLAEIGTQMGITKTRVRQLEARALRKLRQLMLSRREKLRPRG